MSAIAIFTCRQNSHPFQERHVSVHEPVKIGRSVARARPAPNNAIFDCKVLSRNHALLWYENGTFYLQDTKSSNGTFVNNLRLSKGSEESTPREVYSGDIVQFGVDVMENSRRVTHSCIIASVQLYHPDGREATNQHSSPFLNSSGSALGAQSQELYQIAQYLQEALHREQMLENKLATLQRLVSQTQDASESGWQALIDEDRLLSRLEVLENQLAAYSKNQTEDTLRQELTHLQEDKYNYETTAKESLRKVLQEKVDAVRKLSDLERTLSNTEDECSHLRDMCDTSQKELQTLAEKYEEKLNDLAALQDQIQETERKHEDDLDQMEQDKADLQTKLKEMVEQELVLQAKVESLQANNDFTKEQLTNMKARMEALKENNGADIPRIYEQESQGVQVDLVNLLDLQMLQGSNSDDDDDTTTDDENDVKDKDILECLSESREEKITRDSLLNDSDSSKDRDSLTEEQLKATLLAPDTSTSPVQPSEKLNETQAKIEDYKSQLEESELKLKESHNVVEKLQVELESLQSEVNTKTTRIVTLEEKLKLSDDNMNQMIESSVDEFKRQLAEAHKQTNNSIVLTTRLRAQISQLEMDLKQSRSETEKVAVVSVGTSVPDASRQGDASGSNHVTPDSVPQTEVTGLKESLEKAKRTCQQQESDISRIKGELTTSKQLVTRLGDEATSLRRQLEEARKTARDKLEQNTKLKDQLQELDNSSKDVRKQIVSLKDALTESERCAKQKQDEAKQLQLQVHSLQEELEYEKSLKSPPVDSSRELQAHASETKREFLSLKEECSSLRKRVQDIETEMKLSREENHQLQTDYSKLQDSYHELEQLKERLEDRQLAWNLNLTDAQKECDQGKLFEPHMAVDGPGHSQEIHVLQQELKEMSEEYDFLAYKTHTLSVCSMIPLIVLLFGFVMAFYPLLSKVTATETPEQILPSVE